VLVLSVKRSTRECVCADVSCVGCESNAGESGSCMEWTACCRHGRDPLELSSWWCRFSYPDMRCVACVILLSDHTSTSPCYPL